MSEPLVIPPTHILRPLMLPSSPANLPMALSLLRCFQDQVIPPPHLWLVPTSGQSIPEPSTWSN